MSQTLATIVDLKTTLGMGTTHCRQWRNNRKSLVLAPTLDAPFKAWGTSLQPSFIKEKKRQKPILLNSYLCYQQLNEIYN